MSLDQTFQHNAIAQTHIHSHAVQTFLFKFCFTRGINQ